MTFGNKLLNLRKLAGFSQPELADAIGSYQSLVSKWESGKGEPSLDQLQRIVETLRRKLGWVTVDYLVNEAIDEPTDPEMLRRLSPDEELLWVLIRDIGPIEARRRILLAGQGAIAAWAQETGPVKALRALTETRSIPDGLDGTITGESASPTRTPTAPEPPNGKKADQG